MSAGVVKGLRLSPTGLHTEQSFLPDANNNSSSMYLSLEYPVICQDIPRLHKVCKMHLVNINI